MRWRRLLTIAVLFAWWMALGGHDLLGVDHDHDIDDATAVAHAACVRPAPSLSNVSAADLRVDVLQPCRPAVGLEFFASIPFVPCARPVALFPWSPLPGRGPPSVCSITT